MLLHFKCVFLVLRLHALVRLESIRIELNISFFFDIVACVFFATLPGSLPSSICGFQLQLEFHGEGVAWNFFTKMSTNNSYTVICEIFCHWYSDERSTLNYIMGFLAKDGAFLHLLALCLLEKKLLLERLACSSSLLA